MPDHTTLKRCTQCGEAKPATTEYFYQEKRAKDGLQSACKLCFLERQAAYRQDNAEVIRLRKQEEYRRHREAYIQRATKWQREHREENNQLARARWAANREAINARIRERNAARGDEYKAVKRKWKAANRDRINEQTRQAYAENPESFNARSRKWQKANPEKGREKTRRYRKENPDKMRLWGRLNEQTRTARKAQLPSSFTEEDWQRALDYFDGCCAVCGRPPGLFHTIAMDHWIPLASSDCPGHIVTNVIPLCHGIDGCNNSKRDRDALEWAVEKFGKRKGTIVVQRVLAYFGEVVTR